MKRNIIAGAILGAALICTPAFAETGKQLFQQKCAMCHVTKKPTPEQQKHMIAPAAMGVMFHVKQKFKNKEKAIEFIVDYVLNPSKEKSVCLSQTMKKFGIMPSQKGAVTKEQLRKIAEYMWDNFPPKGFKHPKMNQNNAPKQAANTSSTTKKTTEMTGEELAKQYGCFSCHDLYKIRQAPPFAGLARRATRRSTDPEGYIINAIKNGKKSTMFSVSMPAYPNIKESELKKIADWILSLKPPQGFGKGGRRGRGKGRRRGMGMKGGGNPY